MSITVTAIVTDEQWHALRRNVVGASEAGALVGEHEFLTYWALWARKSGRLPPVDDSGAMERGRRLEPVAVQMIRDRYPGWDVVNERTHYADHVHGIGATPDMIVDDPDRGKGVIQIKSVAPSVFRKTWRGESDAVKPPLWIAIQALMEAELVGAQWAMVAALVVDFEIDLHLIEVPIHRPMIAAIKQEALTFWRNVLAGREPDPDYRRDAALIRATLRDEDGSEVDLSAWNELPDLLDRREALKQAEKEAKAQSSAIDAELLHRLGNAAVGRFPGGMISAKTITKQPYQVHPKPYRDLRIRRDHDSAGSDHGRN